GLWAGGGGRRGGGPARAGARRWSGARGGGGGAGKPTHTGGGGAARRGDVPRALSLYDRAEERYEALAMPRALGMLNSHRAEVLLSVRLVPEARNVATRAVRRLAAAGGPGGVAEAPLPLAERPPRAGASR